MGGLDRVAHDDHEHERHGGIVTAVSVVVAGGGTAGHIEPAMALADAVRRLESDARITALGTEKGLDRTLIPPRGYLLELIPPVPLPRKVNSALFRTPGRVNDAVRLTEDVLVRADADVIVGFGGYVALPAYLAARRARLPIIVHEANARPGVANRLAARLTRHVYTASEQVRLPHAVPIGIPLRPAISGLDRPAMQPRARSGFGLLPDAPTLLVTGGSQGAQSLNRACIGAADDLRRAGIQVLHIVGGKNTAAVPPGQPPYAVVPFVEQMHLAYAAADFVLCRSGAMTCAEVSAVGLPAAYVPYPHGNGEQRFNARPIVQAGGGLLVEDAALRPSWIVENVIPIMTDPCRLAGMSKSAAGAGSRDADVVLARAVLNVAAEHRRFGTVR